MQKLIQETVQYTTPDKIDQNDKTGLLEKEKQQGKIQEVRLREMEAQQAQMLMQIHPVIRTRQVQRQEPIHIPTTAQ